MDFILNVLVAIVALGGSVTMAISAALLINAIWPRLDRPHLTGRNVDELIGEDRKP